MTRTHSINSTAANARVVGVSARPGRLSGEPHSLEGHRGRAPWFQVHGHFAGYFIAVTHRDSQGNRKSDHGIGIHANETHFNMCGHERKTHELSVEIRASHRVGQIIPGHVDLAVPEWRPSTVASRASNRRDIAVPLLCDARFRSIPAITARTR
jgi:hypothetical protein